MVSLRLVPDPGCADRPVRVLLDVHDAALASGQALLEGVVYDSAVLSSAEAVDEADDRAHGNSEAAEVAAEGVALVMSSNIATTLDYGVGLTKCTDKILTAGPLPRVIDALVDTGLGIVSVYAGYRGVRLLREAIAEKQPLPKAEKLSDGFEKIFIGTAAGLKTALNLMKSVALSVVHHPGVISGLQIASNVLFAAAGGARVVTGVVRLGRAWQAWQETRAPHGGDATPARRACPSEVPEPSRPRHSYKKLLVEGLVDIGLGGALVAASVLSHGVAPLAILGAVLAVDTAMLAYDQRRTIKRGLAKLGNGVRRLFHRTKEAGPASPASSKPPGQSPGPGGSRAAQSLAPPQSGQVPVPSQCTHVPRLAS